MRRACAIFGFVSLIVRYFASPGARTMFAMSFGSISRATLDGAILWAHVTTARSEFEGGTACKSRVAVVFGSAPGAAGSCMGQCAVDAFEALHPAVGQAFSVQKREQGPVSPRQTPRTELHKEPQKEAQ